MKISKVAVEKLVTELELENVVTVFRLEREAYEAKSGRFYNYFVRGKFGSKDVKVNMMPNLNKSIVGGSEDGKQPKAVRADRASYELLDILFGGQTAVDLYVTQHDMVDNIGEIMAYYKYTAVVSDNDGDRWIDVLPVQKSDKAVMASLIINQVRAEVAEAKDAQSKAGKNK